MKTDRKTAAKKNEDSLMRRLCKTKFRWWNVFSIALVLFFIWAVTYEEPETVWEEPRCPYENYNGYDPNREVTEIVSVDYETRTVTYRPENDGLRTRKTACDKTPQPSGGTVIYDSDGRAHHIDATPEEIIEQLRQEIDFDDLADQADYFPEDE